MKLRVVVLPVLVLMAFLYTGSVLDRASEHGTKKIERSTVRALVKSDIAKFEPSTKVVYNQ